MIMCWCCTN